MEGGGGVMKLALQRADIGLLEVIPEFDRRREVLTKIHARHALAA